MKEPVLSFARYFPAPATQASLPRALITCDKAVPSTRAKC